jgi:hypothetical protein
MVGFNKPLRPPEPEPEPPRKRTAERLAKLFEIAREANLV